MITINIDPVLFHIGPVEIRWYGVMVALAVIAIVAISLREAKRLKIAEEHIYNVAVWGVIGGIIGSRVVHVIDKWSYYSQHLDQIVGFAGVAVYGAVIGAVLAVVLYVWIKKLSLWQMLDVVAPGALVGMAIGRIGCVINGCCYGLPTDSDWGCVYENPNALAPIGIPVQPTQEYHIIWNLAAFGILWALRKRLQPAGSAFLLYIALYGAGDLVIRFFREGELFLFGMQQAQLIGIILLVTSMSLLAFRMVRYRKNQSRGTPPVIETRDESDELKSD